MKFFAMPSEIVLSVFPYVFPIFFYHRMENMAHSIVTMNSIFVFTLAYQVFRELKKKCYQPSEGETNHSITHSISRGVSVYHKGSRCLLVRFVVSTVLSLGGFVLFTIHIATVRNLSVWLLLSKNLKGVVPSIF